MPISYVSSRARCRSGMEIEERKSLDPRSGKRFCHFRNELFCNLELLRFFFFCLNNVRSGDAERGEWKCRQKSWALKCKARSILEDK